MKKTEFYAEIEQILEISSKSITGGEALADLEGWDSLSVLSFLAMADANLETMISASQLAGCRTVEDLTKLFPGKISEE